MTRMTWKRKKKPNRPQLLASDAWRKKKLVSIECRTAPTFHCFVVFANRPSWWMRMFTRTEWQQKKIVFIQSEFICPFKMWKKKKKWSHILIYLVDSNNDLCFYVADAVFCFFVFFPVYTLRTHGTLLIPFRSISQQTFDNRHVVLVQQWKLASMKTLQMHFFFFYISVADVDENILAFVRSK